jgi:hypothetical protein
VREPKAKTPCERSVGHQVKPGMVHTISLIELELSDRLEGHGQGRFAGSIQVAKISRFSRNQQFDKSTSLVQNHALMHCKVPKLMM